VSPWNWAGNGPIAHRAYTCVCMEQRCNDTDRGEPKARRKSCRSETLSATNPMWSNLGANPGLLGKKPDGTWNDFCRPALLGDFKGTAVCGVVSNPATAGSWADALPGCCLAGCERCEVWSRCTQTPWRLINRTALCTWSSSFCRLEHSSHSRPPWGTIQSRCHLSTHERQQQNWFLLLSVHFIYRM
jgi:hypothetical protein